jgi:formyltetrahydrofolate deformylase
MASAILLISCKDQKGLVLKLASFVASHNGNITDLDEHVDASENHFYARVCWEMDVFTLTRDELHKSLEEELKPIAAKWSLAFSDTYYRTAIFVSKTDHCLHELLWRYQRNEFNIEIPLIISNHEDLAPLAKSYNIDFHYIPITKQNKLEQENYQLSLLKKYNIDTLVLARYMQILSPNFIDAYKNKIINIHHSFLPAFAGGSPYHQAFERGVKIIGATSHFVTKVVDEGPIIEQDIIRITHKDDVENLKRKGRDLERLVLSKAISLYSEQRIIVRANKTVVFD